MIYPDDFINKIICGDCLEVMKDIPNNSIDMILCDLPYENLNKTSGKNKWDFIIPFDNLWFYYEKIIKPNGAIVLFGQGMFTAKCMLSNEKLWRYNLIWKKGNRASGFLNANRMPMRNHEDIMIFYSKIPIYNPQFSEGFPTHRRGRNGGKSYGNRCYGDYIEFETRNYENKKFPKSILDFDREHPPIHPTQKPVLLFEYLIKTYTNENYLVLDNCIGSGTTAIACRNTNRRFIGIDISEEYCNLSRERLETENTV